MKQVDSLYPESFIDKYSVSGIHLDKFPSINDLIKKDTEEYGTGIYALRPYKRGELIGYFIAKPTKTIRQHSLQRSEGEHLEDPYFVGYLLHNCTPNVVLDMHAQKVFCIKDIAVDEPLCMDYASTEDALFRQFACACDSKDCRMWITGRNEKVNAEGELYLNTYLQSA